MYETCNLQRKDQGCDFLIEREERLDCNHYLCLNRPTLLLFFPHTDLNILIIPIVSFLYSPIMQQRRLLLPGEPVPYDPSRPWFPQYGAGNGEG
ncbi:hypothetical protein BO85DRAFT_307842 [Aspergillus piperis CBS 112811]|uniref:Uncharacterized protein n=1 Tax=Aspergillus piperis CBS 112811 TaxID=1448313 RepID=A0A8G1R1W4_9EURO|nr:hypothetical protein BO85DRAFT_307842 [Aspergillus piperis CBS 112811]RAH57662.1 hypothetical protein BO85DRAFT_307842 [Aspergillus piperis CBS 112811]